MSIILERAVSCAPPLQFTVTKICRLATAPPHPHHRTEDLGGTKHRSAYGASESTKMMCCCKKSALVFL